MGIFDNFESTSCCSCGIIFGLPAGYLKNRVEDKKGFHCPNGHVLSYNESTADKLQRELNRYKQRQAMLEDDVRLAGQRADRAEASAKKLKKRMSAGTCPCCQRTFGNMATHMKKQHPTFVAEQTSNVVKLKA